MTRLKAIVAELEAFNKWFAIEYPNAGSDYADRIYPIWQAAIAASHKPVSLSEWQSVIRDAVHKHGLNGLEAAKQILEDMEIAYVE